jgi:hypothetical protein
MMADESVFEGEDDQVPDTRRKEMNDTYANFDSDADDQNNSEEDQKSP